MLEDVHQPWRRRDRSVDEDSGGWAILKQRSTSLDMLVSDSLGVDV